LVEKTSVDSEILEEVVLEVDIMTDRGAKKRVTGDPLEGIRKMPISRHLCHVRVAYVAIILQTHPVLTLQPLEKAKATTPR
jgi:hypothetical protein